MSEVTENTVNNLVADFLRGRDLQITTEYSGHSSYGRHQPDFSLRNSGFVFGEGEWESSFLKGLKQAHDFANIPGASGSFVIAYPDRIKDVIAKRIRDTSTPGTLLQGFRFRGFLLMKGARAELFHGSIDEVVEWLRDGILHKPRKENAGAFVSLMRDIVEELSGYLPTSGEYPTFFEHIIATMPKHVGELEMAKRAAAYLLLNQVVFYRILSLHKYEPLDPETIKQPGDLHVQYFQRVLDDNYAAIFSSNVSSLFPSRSLPFIQDMVNYVNAVQPESFTRDLLGSIFHELIPQKVRKSVAAYYTNPEAARLLAKLVIDDPRATVADLACGSGTLLMAAYDRKSELLGTAITADDHRRFLEEEITGCDIMPFAAHLAVVQLALRQPGFLTDKVRIAVQDSTTLRPGTRISPLQSSMPQGQASLQIFEEGNLEKHKIRKGAISSNGKGHSFKLEKVDATLMNPPFTRKQLIGKDYRRLLTDHFPDYTDYESKEQSLFGYFVFLADRFLRNGGRMGFVLPATSIRQMSSRGMRQLIRDRYDLEYIILSGHRMAFSEDAAFSEILLIAKKRTPMTRPKKSFVLATIRSKPTLDNMSMLVSQLKDAYSMADSATILGATSSKEDIDFKVITTEELETDDWLALLPGEENIGVDLSSSRHLTTLRAIVGDDGIIQGIRFEGSSDLVNVKNTLISRQREVGTRLNWVITEELADSFKARSQTTGAEVVIPRNALRPATRSPSGQNTMRISEPPDFAVCDRFSDDEAFWEDQNADALVARRGPHLNSREGRLLIAGRNHVGVTSDNTHFISFCSDDPVVPTWSFWSVRFGNPEDAKIVCLWMNSIFALTHLYDKRIAGTGAYIGWLKADLLDFPIPNLSSLKKSAKEKLLELFDELGNKPFPSLLSQLKNRSPDRIKLDMTVAGALELHNLENEQTIRKLYDLVTGKFEILRDVHANK